MPNVLCVTLNPCLDKTLTVPEWRPGENVRGTKVREVVGGKGNNVARALRRLGMDARPVTFLGGLTGHRCRQLLQSDDQLEPLAVETEAETRTILTVRTGETANQTAFFDPDPRISVAEADRLRAEVERAISSAEVQAMTLSGSSPAESTHSLYAEFVEMARRRGMPVLLDTYGPALRSASRSVPDVLQLNRKEIAGALGLADRELTQSAMRDWLSDWVRRGTRLAVVTQGTDPVLAVSAEGIWIVPVPRIEAVNPIGSGDCVLAGMCFGVLRGWSDSEILRFAVACGVANAEVWDAGAIDPKRVSDFSEMTEALRLTSSDDKVGTIRRS